MSAGPKNTAKRLRARIAAKLPKAIAVNKARLGAFEVLFALAALDEQSFHARRQECRDFHRLRCAGWRVLPSGEWAAPTGERLRDFEAAVSQLRSVQSHQPQGSPCATRR